MENKILICSCHSTEHQVVIMYDDEDNNAYLHIFLSERRFFKRLLYGIKYIFGYKCKYGHWDEIILNDTHSETLIDLGEKLKAK